MLLKANFFLLKKGREPKVPARAPCGFYRSVTAAAAAAITKMCIRDRPHVFTGSVEHAIAHIEESIQGKVDDRFLRWYAVKLFERDDKVQDELKLDKTLMDHIDQHIKDCLLYTSCPYGGRR